MPDIAKMRFQSAKSPEEKGFLILSTDGTIRMQPSEEMVEALAALEQKAVEFSGRSSKITALTLIGLGLFAAVAGWYAGRIGGKLRHRMTNPRNVSDVVLTYIAERGLQLTLRDRLAPPVMLTWERGEYTVPEAEHFVEVYEKMKRTGGDVG